MNFSRIKESASSLRRTSGKKKATYAAGLLFNIFCYIILITIGYIVLYPLIYTIVTSIRTPESYLDPTRHWIPTSVYLGHYKRAIEYMEFGKSILNTVRYEMVSALLEVASCAVAAYGFARFNFKFKNIFMVILFLTILVPSPMIIIPLVTNFSHLDVLGIFGLLNKLTGIDLRLNLMGTGFTYWIPSFLGVGLRSGILIYIYIQFFKALPRELEEAAWIDGAGSFRTFLSIAVPSSGVVIITVTVFSLVWHWNDYFIASMYTVGESTLATAAAELPDIIKAHGEYGSAVTSGTLLAGTILYIVPLLIVYLFLQRGFIESVDRVGITG